MKAVQKAFSTDRNGYYLFLCLLAFTYAALSFLFRVAPSLATTSSLMGSDKGYELDFAKMVPAKATFVAKFNAGKVLSIPGAVDLVIGKLETDQQKRVAEFVQKTGVDLSRDIKYVFAFGGDDPAVMSGLFLGASLKEEQLVDFVAVKSGMKKLTMKDYMGFKVRFRDEKDPVAFAFLSDDLSIVAPPSVIESVVDLKVGWDNSNLEKGNVELAGIGALGRDEMILWAGAVVPDKVRKSSEKYHANLKKVRSIFISVIFEGALKLEMTAWVDDPASVPGLAAFLEKGAAAAGKNDFFGNILNLSNTLKVTRGKDTVRAELYCGLDTVAKLAESLRDGIMAFSKPSGTASGKRKSSAGSH
jgi:hypothetical protein